MQVRVLLFSWAMLFALSSHVMGMEGSSVHKALDEQQKEGTLKSIEIPSPFNHWSSCDLAKALYPAYDCKSGSVDENTLGAVGSVTIRKSKAGTYLIVLFESYAKDAEAKGSEKNCDIAMYTKRSHKVSLVASTKRVMKYGYYDTFDFDLKHYDINNNETAVGVRIGTGHWGSEELILLRRVDNSFEEIFARPMIEADYAENLGKGYENKRLIRKISELEIISQKSKMKDLKITTRWYFLDKYGEDDAKVLKRTVETWHWSDFDKKYNLVKSLPSAVAADKMMLKRPMSATMQ